LKISWSKAKNAKKYKVYRATSKNGKYKLIKTTTSRSYSNSKLTTGKTYYYKVRAINGKKNGKYSTVKTGKTKMGKPTVTVTASDSNIIKWSKVSGASWYNIYRATSKNGKYSLIKSGNTSRTYYDNSLTGGKTYYYKVKAFNGYTSGSFSAIKSVKAKTVVTYSAIKKEVCGCNMCGYPMFTRNGDSISHLENLYEHPVYTDCESYPNCTGGGWHSEEYFKGYCYNCGGVIEYRMCCWANYGSRCSKNAGPDTYEKVEKYNDSAYIMYYQSCDCGENIIMEDESGNYLYLK